MGNFDQAMAVSAVPLLTALLQRHLLVLAISSYYALLISQVKNYKIHQSPGLTPVEFFFERAKSPLAGQKRLQNGGPHCKKSCAKKP